MKAPKVSIICLCYNQAQFVKQALDSVLAQSYTNIELIIVDDASPDNSQEVIQHWIDNKGEVTFLPFKENVGNTRAFNQGLKLASGQYVIDLSGDDLLCPNRVEAQVAFFEKQKSNVGVIYSDVEYIDEQGQSLHTHFSESNRKAYIGDVFEKLIDTYFVPPPSMMMRMEVLKALDGYDEELAYEDFDFWIRSSRNWAYAFQSDALTKVRQTKGSHSTQYGAKYDRQLRSTVAICHKIALMIRSESEQEALIRRLKYEMRHAFLYGRKNELNEFFILLNQVNGQNLAYTSLNVLGSLGLRLTWVKQLIYLIRRD